MDWDQLVDAAGRCGWFTYVGTADGGGRPHVAVVAPGFTEATVWFATRTSSRKYRNLRENDEVAFHWPTGVPDAPGELAAWGTAVIHDTDEARQRIWHSGVLPYDLAGFFGEPGNTDFVFVEVALRRARLQTRHERLVWERG